MRNFTKQHPLASILTPIFLSLLMVFASSCSSKSRFNKSGVDAQDSLEVPNEALKGLPFETSSDFTGLCNLKNNYTKTEIKNGTLTFDHEVGIMNKINFHISCIDTENAANTVSIHLLDVRFAGNNIRSANGLRGNMGARGLMANINIQGVQFKIRVLLEDENNVQFQLIGTLGTQKMIQSRGQMHRNTPAQ